MTIWINTLQGRTLSKYDDEHRLLCYHSEELDRICDSLRVPQVSSFFDMTALASDFSEDTIEEEEECDPETGWSYGIDDMHWFDATIGQTTLLALREQIPFHPELTLKSEMRRWLIEEIDDCLKKLSALAENGGKFHFAIIP